MEGTIQIINGWYDPVNQKYHQQCRISDKDQLRHLFFVIIERRCYYCTSQNQISTIIVSHARTCATKQMDQNKTRDNSQVQQY